MNMEFIGRAKNIRDTLNGNKVDLISTKTSRYNTNVFVTE